MMSFQTLCFFFRCHPNRPSLRCIGYQDASHEEATHPLAKTPRPSCWKLSANRKTVLEDRSQRVKIPEGNERLLRVSLKTLDFVWKRYWNGMKWVRSENVPGVDVFAIWARESKTFRRRLDEEPHERHPCSLTSRSALEVIQVIQQWFQTWIFPKWESKPFPNPNQQPKVQSLKAAMCRPSSHERYQSHGCRAWVTFRANPPKNDEIQTFLRFCTAILIVFDRSQFQDPLTLEVAIAKTYFLMPKKRQKMIRQRQFGVSKRSWKKSWRCWCFQWHRAQEDLQVKG